MFFNDDHLGQEEKLKQFLQSHSPPPPPPSSTLETRLLIQIKNTPQVKNYWSGRRWLTGGLLAIAVGLGVGMQARMQSQTAHTRELEELAAFFQETWGATLEENYALSDGRRQDANPSQEWWSLTDTTP